MNLCLTVKGIEFSGVVLSVIRRTVRYCVAKDEECAFKFLYTGPDISQIFDTYTYVILYNQPPVRHTYTRVAL
jgi:hypothetical protein